MLIQAKPTIYKGIQFRSRLEVQWAKFLDERQVIWEYEKYPFLFGEEGYLPDFYFPELGLWGEVKPTTLDSEAFHKVVRVVELTHQPFALLEGNPEPKAYRMMQPDFSIKLVCFWGMLKAPRLPPIVNTSPFNMTTEKTKKIRVRNRA
jgi:hypothetical protein